MKELMSTVEAAKLIGISRPAVHYAIKRGNIKARKLGRDWMVEKESALDYKRKREESPTGRYPRST